MRNSVQCMLPVWFAFILAHCSSCLVYSLSSSSFSGLCSFFLGGGVYETGGWGRLPCGQSWQSFEPHAFLWPVPDWCLPLCSRKPKIRQFLNQAVHICFAHPFCAWSFLTHGGAFPLCLCIAFAGAFSPFPSLTRSFMPGRELQAVSADALRAPHLR